MKTLPHLLQLCGLALISTPMLQAGQSGKLTREIWQNITGNQISTFPSSNLYFTPPDSISVFTGASTPIGVGDQYVSRIRGYVIPAVSGDYRFYVAGNDSAELWLSPDDSKFTKEKIAFFTSATNERQWDRFPSQESALVTLQANQRYFVEIVHKEETGGDHVQLGWKAPGGAIEQIPATFIESFTHDANDVVNNELPDDWEIAHDLDPADDGSVDPGNGPFGDPDRDGYTNLEEYRFGLDPQVAAGSPGKLLREVWFNLPGPRISDLTQSPRFYEPADIRELLADSQLSVNLGDRYGQRLRGFVTAPQTGQYTFWISGDDDTELWLSTDDSKFNRKRIAFHVGSSGQQNWTASPNQKSALITLQQGQKYYLEVLHKENTGADYVAVAWTPPGGTRELLPTAALESFYLHPNDYDDDGLGDDWEIANGLDPNDATGANGPSGDPLGIGYTNLDRFRRSYSLQRVAGLTGGLTREVWLNLEGQKISDLTHHLRFYRTADIYEFLPSAASPVDVADHYGQRLRGYVTAPVTGDYTFWISGDDHTELWLSSNDSKFHKRRIAGHDGSTNPQEWTRSPNQQSAVIHLEAGQKYYIEALHKEGFGYDHVAIAWQISGGSRELIPTSALQSFIPDPLDPEDSGLPTAWELQHNLDPHHPLGDSGIYGDPDGDLMSNLVEYQRGLNPRVADHVVDHFVVERWNDVPGYSIHEFLQSNRILGTPSSKFLLPADGLKFEGQYFATRGRAYITPETTGNYTFWLSARTSAELWLSSDDVIGKYAKRRIAHLDTELGGGTGISSTDPNLWDQFASQRSAPIHLEAGKSYFVETLQINGHSSNPHSQIAWSRNGGPREILPRTVVKAYLPTADDVDDDFLPDAWEAQYGLSVTDNGALDPQREGERGDFDSDGLTNLEEYLAGTNPANPDTDGDGLTDAEELHSIGSDPLSADSVGENIIEVIDITQPAGGSMNWSPFGEGVVGERFRGSIEFDITVPESDRHWIVLIRGRLLGATQPVETLPLKVSIGSINLGAQPVSFRIGQPSSLRVLTPRLTAGTHRVSIFVDNFLARRSYQLLGVELREPTGFDDDQDGIPDWLASFRAKNSWSLGAAATSHVSPFFVEGGTRFEGNVSLTANSTNVTINPGTHSNHWIADVSLAATGTTSLTASFDGGTDVKTSEIAWLPVDLASATHLDLRAGDSLRFHFPQEPNDSATASYNIGGWSEQAPAGEAVNYTFGQAGTFTLTANHVNGPSASVTIQVHAAITPQTLILGSERSRYFDLPQVPFGHTLQTVDPLRIIEKTLHGGTGSRIRLECTANSLLGSPAALIRLDDGGPVLGRLPVSVMNAVTPLSAYQISGDSPFAGYRYVSTPLVITNLPEGYTVRINIARAGVMFADGSTQLILTKDNFKDGIVLLSFLFPESLAGGYCFNVEIRNENGQVVASY